MVNRVIEKLRSNKPILVAYITAGFPYLESTIPICRALQDGGVDMIEIGFPFSDPLADGETIQRSNEIAIRNGMSLHILFDQLAELRSSISIPVILMGYLNPVLKFGIDEFFCAISKAGVDGAIIPDLPHKEFISSVSPSLKQHNLVMPFLVTPTTSDSRVREIDSLSSGFIYAVSSNAVTGGTLDLSSSRSEYIRKLKSLGLSNPILTGFGITNRQTVAEVQSLCDGAIVGSALIKALGSADDVTMSAKDFVISLR